MYSTKTPDVYASEIAGFLNAKLNGKDFIVHHPSSVRDLRDRSFFYVREGVSIPKARLEKCKDVLVFTSKKIDVPSRASFIVTKMPRVDFMKVVNEFFIEFDTVKIAQSSRVDQRARLGRGVFIGEHSVIGSQVSIGSNTKILNNVVISGRVTIGDNCLIKDNTTIGSEGFDFEYDEDGMLVHSPQIGEIVIGNDVWVGSNTSIESSAIERTLIGANVKIDDLVHIGGSSSIGKDSMIAAGTVISRNVVVGEKCLISPNVSVRDNVVVGSRVVVGIGAVVVKDLKDSGVYVGNPARLLKKRNTAKEVL